MKLQKQLSRKVGNIEYPKFVVVLPPEKIKEAGFKDGEDLIVTAKNGKMIIERKK